MARRLKKLTDKIHTYIRARFPSKQAIRQPIDFNVGHITLHPALNVCFLQGEAFLCLTFFTFLHDKNIHNVMSQDKAWKQLIGDKKFIQQVVENSELLSFFNLNAPVADRQNLDGELYQKLCYTTFCILLWDIYQRDKSFAQQVVVDLVNHFLPTLYPKQIKQTDSTALKTNLTKLIAKNWNIRPQIKESFTTSENSVVFSLLAKRPKSKAVNLITVEGKRLKPTRLNAYQELIKGIEKGSIELPSPK